MTTTASASLRAHALAGGLLIGASFIGFGLFATSVEMPAAIVADGVVQPESHRKKVQHLEGGIVAEILVRDGDKVRAGAPVLRIDDTRIRATLATLEAQMRDQRALEARLTAERALAAAITFPADLLSDPAAAGVTAAQTRLFEARRASLDGQIAVLRSRKAQVGENMAGLVAQREAARAQLDSRIEERPGLEALAAKGFMAKAKLEDHAREIARLQGIVGSTDAQIAGNRAAQGEAELQIRQVSEVYRQTASDGLADVVPRMSDLDERIRVARDALGRTEVRAPVDGTVQGLRFVTRGGVAAAGEPLMEIVPAADHLVVEARIPSTAIDDLQVGMRAGLRFPAFHARNLPDIHGTVTRLSADALYDKDLKVSYFQADIVVATASLPARIASGLQPGMPAEVVVVTQARTLADYLLEPWREMMRGAMNEG